jgi:chromosome segregation ATPase
MSDNPTHENPDARSFEERVFARFDALDARFDGLEKRMGALEGRMDVMEVRMGTLESRVGSLESKVDRLDEKVDRRLQETRPIWEAVQTQLERLNSKVDILISDFYEMRTDIVRLDKRVTSLEGQRT